MTRRQSNHKVQKDYIKDKKLARILMHLVRDFVAFCSFFPCSLTVVHKGRQQKVEVDNKKVGVDNEKALELTNSTVFHRGRQ